MEVKGHDPALSGEGVLGVGGVLDGVETDEPHALPEEVVAAQADGEEVVVAGVPADGGHVLFSLFFVGETPDGQLVALVLHGVEGLPVGPIVLDKEGTL